MLCGVGGGRDRRAPTASRVPHLFIGRRSSETTMNDTYAFVGVTGGAGTTRLAVECAATLARAGDDVAVLDAAFATQGLARYVDGRLDPDLTRVCTDEAALDDALIAVWPDAPGRAALAPTRAPFERLARAKSPEAARRLEDAIDAAAARFDHVIVDVPPVAGNQAVAAATSADRRVLVAPDTGRGADRLPLMRGRLVDLGVEPDALVVNRVRGDDPSALPEADHAVPAGDPSVTRPASLDPDETFAPAVAEATEGVFDRSLDLAFPSPGLLD